MKNAKYSLITGASSGMGEATAKLLANERNLVLCGRDLERLNHVREVCSASGSDVLLFPYDLENASGAGDAIAAFLKEQSIEVDAFLHFAGMVDVLPANRTKYSLGVKVMNVNYFSAMEIICALLKKKVNNKSLKTILFISSIVTRGGQAYTPQYTASKGAIEAITKGLATELAPDARVNAISPGFYPTRITQTIFVKDRLDGQETGEMEATRSYLKPMGVDAVAKAARFLISSDADYITGVVLPVDGGHHMRL